jgi:ribosomal protein L11 methyltransferase
MAFGSGTHETTKMCLELLEDNMKLGDDVLDLGCGSGILSVAAKLLGAESVTAVDFDPVSVKATTENAAINDVKINAVLGDVLNDANLFNSIKLSDDKRYDIVLANIVADVLISIAPKVRDLISRCGYFISSGIINDRLFDVLNAYTDAGFTILEVERMANGALY